MVLCERSFVAVTHTHTPCRTARPPTAPPRRERDEEMGQQTVSDLDSSFKNGILRSRMGAAAARSGAPCVPTATPGPWDIPPAIGDAWFIHYPIDTGCVAARLETRSAARSAQTTNQEDGRGDTRSGRGATAPQRALARRRGRRAAQAAAELAVRLAARVLSRLSVTAGTG